MSGYDCERYGKLGRAAADVQEVGAELARRGAAVRVVSDPDRAGVPSVAPASSQGTTALVYWAGHAVAGGQTDLRLVLRDTDEAGSPRWTLDPARLTGGALARGVRQVLLVLDTCHDGTAIPNVAALASKVDGPSWVGVLATAQPYEQALEGQFGRIFTDLLRHGPDGVRPHWSAYDAAVRGVDVLRALAERWPVYAGRQPWVGSFGTSLPMLVNPRHDPAAPPRTLAGAAGPGDDDPAALDRALAELPKADRAVARHLLRVAASAFGAGVPARDVWPRLASVLRNDEVRADLDDYTDADVARVLEPIARHVLVSGADGRAVYRLAGPRLVAHVLAGTGARYRVDLAAAAARGDDPYLRRYAEAHRARALRRPVSATPRRPAGLTVAGLSTTIAAVERRLTDDPAYEDLRDALATLADTVEGSASRHTRDALDHLAAAARSRAESDAALTAALAALTRYRDLL
ncbi:hypothetical protein Val02_18160 [Virgisporangium aliadipatigenens]|uniref:Caspase domain-containing protein n=1 Tax=Virgisporangium aliadipatigenens TaxID=741659 RepID=A0A8J3YJ44_9ACTN|nr:hypothetical protein [Virgisporangium aliadipatigenens]GIJ44930.1 hypothetical protein Val02_18160 [Virgisporangium aliadipatigenens]